MTKGILDRYIRSEHDTFLLAEEEAIAQAAVVIAELMAECGVSQRELAERLDISEGRISQILSAESNLTVKSLARIGHALGYRLQLNFVGTHSTKQKKSQSKPMNEEKTPWPTHKSVVPMGIWRRREEDVSPEEGEAFHAVA